MNLMRTSLLIVAVTAAAALAPSREARADNDLAIRSCDLLGEAADAHARQLYDEISDGLLNWSRWHRVKNGLKAGVVSAEISPNRLPDSLAEFKGRISLHDFELARTVTSLRRTLAERADPGIASELRNLTAALQEDLKQAAEWDADEQRQSGLHESMSGPDWGAMRYTICGASIALESETGHVAICGVIDLMSGQVSYALERTESGPAGKSLADLGAVEPAKAAGDRAVRRGILRQLKQHEREKFSADCDQDTGEPIEAAQPCNLK